MKKIRKGKKMLLILIIAIVVVLAIVGIANIVKNSKKPKEPSNSGQVIELPETVYSDMKVKNIYVQYLNEQDKTKLRMTIDNTSNKVAKAGVFDAVLIGADEEVLTSMEARIVEDLEIGEQCNVEVILKGDQTAVTQIKLIEK